MKSRLEDIEGAFSNIERRLAEIIEAREKGDSILHLKIEKIEKRVDQKLNEMTKMFETMNLMMEE